MKRSNRKRSDTYVSTPRVSWKSRREKAGDAAFFSVLVLSGLVFLYGALLVFHSPRALLDPKDAGVVRLIPTSATVESIEYRVDESSKCTIYKNRRRWTRVTKPDITFRFVANDGKFIHASKTMCRRDVPGWGYPIIKRTTLREGEEILLWYDPADPSQISWPRRYSPRLMFTGLTLMVAPVTLLVGISWAYHFVRTRSSRG